MGYLIAVIGFILCVVAIFAPSDDGRFQETKAKSAAMHYLQYRSTVHLYLFDNTEFTGILDDNVLDLPDGFIQDKWHTQVVDTTCYIYGTADNKTKNAVKTISKGSHSIGEKRGGIFYPNYGGKNFLLPGFIPENALVSIMEMP